MNGEHEEEGGKDREETVRNDEEAIGRAETTTRRTRRGEGKQRGVGGYKDEKRRLIHRGAAAQPNATRRRRMGATQIQHEEAEAEACRPNPGVHDKEEDGACVPTQQDKYAAEQSRKALLRVFLLLCSTFTPEAKGDPQAFLGKF